MFKKHLSQQGITLVELLVALVIASLIIGLVTSVLISTVKFNDNTQNRINLRQESNRIVSEIRADHRNDKSVCYDTLLASNEIKMDMQLDNTTLTKGECFAVKHTNDLPVKFTLSEGPKNTYTIDTVVEGKNSSDLSFTIPEKDSGFIDNLLLDNVFVYGSKLSIGGGSKFSSLNNGKGTIVINNSNKADLLLDSGGTTVSVHNIYIDKKGNEVEFNSNTKLGDKNFTKIVHVLGDVRFNNGDESIWAESIFIEGETTFDNSGTIEGKKVVLNGNVQLYNGGAKLIGDTITINGETILDKEGSSTIKGKTITINGDVHLNEGDTNITGDTIYISGNVSFRGGFIKGKKVIIDGNVTFNNESDKIDAGEVYISGKVKPFKTNINHISGTMKSFIKPDIEAEKIPVFPSFTPPSLHEDKWYEPNGYHTQSGGDISNGARIYSPRNLLIDSWQDSKNNVIIISKGDIEITNFTNLSGILFAPNGKVKILGGSFTGVIIARDGLSTRGDTQVIFKNASEFLKANDPIPFE